VGKIKNGGNLFLVHEIRRIDSGKIFQNRGNVFRIGGNMFYDEKQNSDQNSGGKKVRNWNNCGILWNSDQIPQPSVAAPVREIGDIIARTLPYARLSTDAPTRTRFFWVHK
jgi:hypothetical protein